MKKYICVINNLIFVLFSIICINALSINTYAENIVIVIDPGHGGEATGGTMDDRVEREINLITANAMKDRLEEYEGVDVYLTRTNNEDKELTRKQRFEFAEYVNASFLYSIHYNMSENHTLYGSEVWVCSSGEYNQKGSSFAAIELEGLTSLGLFDRGIKCRLGKDGGEYYGILKYSREYNIPAVIIEHCHLDEERDSAFWNEEAFKKFGEIDADSVAKYYHLKSETLGIDNTNYVVPEITHNSNADPDTTAPEYCNIELLECNEDEATIKIESNDNETYIQYYSYSYDNGKNWSRLEDWNDRNSDSIIINVELPLEKEAAFIVKTQNKYDLDIDSNVISLPAKVIPEIEEEAVVKEFTEVYIEPAKINETENKPKADLIKIIIIILVIGTIALVSGTLIYFISNAIQSPKKRKKRNSKINHETR